MTYRIPLYAFLMSAILLGTALPALVTETEAAPKRPASNWNQCTPSGDQLNRLQAANPGAMEACSNMAKNAQAQGKSFSFMCDPEGHVACCDESSCTNVGMMAKRQLPGGVRPETSAGSVQIPPSQPGVKPGAAPMPGGPLSPSQTR